MGKVKLNLIIRVFIAIFLAILIFFLIYLNTNIVYADNDINNSSSNTNEEREKITYEAHVQGYGWQGESQEASLAGTTGIGYRMEAIKINNNNKQDFKITYKAHVSNIGWQEWKDESEIAGTTRTSTSNGSNKNNNSKFKWKKIHNFI